MRPHHAIRSLAWGTLLLLVACSDNTGPSSGTTRLEISPSEVALRIGETQTLTISFIDARGREVEAEGTVTWASSDETVVVVGEGGEIRGVAPGSAKVTASSGTLSGSVDVLVLVPSVVLETDAAASATIDTAGGTITATGKDGTRYTLRIPAGALDSPTQITVTPIDQLEALPLTGGFAVGVDFAPDGLEFSHPAELEIVAGAPPGSGRLVGFSLNDDAFRLKPARLSGDTLRLVIGHFSGAGAATGSAEEVSAAASQPGTAEEEAEAALAEALANAGEGGDPDPAELAAMLASWYENSVAPGLANASGSGSAEAAIAAFLRWWENAALLGVDDRLSDKIEAGLAAVANIISSEIDRLNTQCRNNNDPSLVPQIMKWASTAALMGLDTPGSGLDFASVIAGLCQQLVIHSVAFPDTVETGEPVKLEVVAGFSIDGNPPTATNPVEVSFSAGGSASVTPEVGMVGADGRLTATVTPNSGQKKVVIDIVATSLAFPFPPAQQRVEAIVDQQVEVTISPEKAEMITGDTMQFTATVEGADDDWITWSATGGNINERGLYTAPNEPGTYTVTATSAKDPSASATAEVEVVPGSIVTPMLQYRRIQAVWTSVAYVWAGKRHDVPEAQIFDSYSISASSSLGFGSLAAEYTYGDDGSLTEFQVKGSIREYDPVRAGPTNGGAYFRLLFRVRGMPLNVVITGNCSLERDSSRILPDEHLSIHIHNEPSNNNVDIRYSHKGHSGCFEGTWERTNELGPGIYSLSIADYGLLDVDYDFTIRFEEIEEEDDVG